MKRFVVLDKKIGETPLEALMLWKQAHPAYVGVPATYAGRLDPLASGKLLVLLGEECKRKDAYTGLDKEYEVSILLDLATDTGDLLGMPQSGSESTFPSKDDVEEVLREQLGTRSHAYPLFSSKTVDGVPLFMHALTGTKVTVPTHPETIHRIVFRDIRSESSETIQAYIEKALSVVPRDDSESKGAGNDFRQDTIRAAWTSLFNSTDKREYCVIRIKVVCGTGTYMRTLAERVGEALGTCAVAASIHRTRIGVYKPGLFGGLWLKQF
jgi:tRNA pseudouridine(55) synthase